MSTNNNTVPINWDLQNEDSLLRNLFADGSNTETLSSLSETLDQEDNPLISNNKPNDGSLLKDNKPLSLLDDGKGGGFSYIYNVKICEDGSGVLKEYENAHPKDNELIMICERTDNEKKTNFLGTFVLMKYGPIYKKLAQDLHSKIPHRINSRKGQTSGVLLQSLEDEISDNHSILNKNYTIDVGVEKVRIATIAELVQKSSADKAVDTVFESINGGIDWAVDGLSDLIEKAKFTEEDYIPKKGDNDVDLIDYITEAIDEAVEELGELADYVIPDGLQKFLSNTFDAAMEELERAGEFVFSKLPQGCQKILKKIYRLIQEGIGYFKEFCQIMSNLIEEEIYLFKALLMGFVNGLLSTIQTLLKVVGWLIKPSNPNKTVGEIYKDGQSKLEFVEDFFDLIYDKAGEFFEAIRNLVYDFSIDKMKDVLKVFIGKTEGLTPYHYAYFAGSFLFEVVVGVILAIFTGGATAIAEAVTFAQKATALLRLIAREAISVATMGVVEILQLFRLLITKFVQACQNGWAGFKQFLEKLLNNKADDIVENEGKVLDDLDNGLDAFKFKTITKEIMKQEMPEDFLNAMKKFGRTEDEILDYFTKYHNENDYIFLNEIENLLQKNPALTKTDAFALWGYTTNYFYFDLNNWLRKGTNVRKTKEISKIITTALAKMPKYNGLAYRALEFSDEVLLLAFIKKHKKGKKIVYDDFVSCGSTKGAAFFDKAKKNVFLEIEVKNAPVISDFADGIKLRGYAKEELLLLQGRKFKVLDRVEQDGKYVITLKEI